MEVVDGRLKDAEAKGKLTAVASLPSCFYSTIVLDWFTRGYIDALSNSILLIETKMGPMKFI